MCDRLSEAVYAVIECGRLRNVSLNLGLLSSQDLGYTVSHHIPLFSTMEPRHSMHKSLGQAIKGRCYGSSWFIVRYITWL